MGNSRATGPGAHGPQSRRAAISPALAPRSLWLLTAAPHVVLMEGPLLDTRITGGKLAMHGRFVHLATKLLIRENRSELLSTSSQRRMRHSCRQQPSLWCLTMWQQHYGIQEKASRVSSSGDANSVTPHAAPQHHGPLLCHSLPIFWPGRAGWVSLPVQGPM